MSVRFSIWSARLLAGAAVAALAAGSTLAADAPVDLEGVIVTAVRAPTPLADVPAPVSVVTAGDIADRQAVSYPELLERLPGVDFFGGPRVQGEMPSIRGATGRQIVAVIDGARQNASPGLSSPLFLEPFFLSRAEVLKGVSSAVYGGGGIGGALTFTTLDAGGLLSEGDQLGADLRAESQSANEGRRLLARAYGRQGAFDGFVGLTTSDWGPIRQGGGTTLRPGDGQAVSLLAKAGWQATDTLRAELSHLYYDMEDFQPNNPQADASFPYFQNNWATQRQTVLNLGAADAEGQKTLDLSVYVTRLETGADPNLKVTPVLTSSSTLTDTLGFSGADTWRFATGALAHRITVGADGYRDKIESRTDGLPGTVSPDGEQTSLGGFVRDEITLTPWLSLTPAVRYDRFETELKSGASPTTSDDRVSPSLAVTVKPVSGAMVYLSRGSGFRAPAVNELYQSLSTPTAFANFRPNPALKPETSEEWDAGARWSGDAPLGLGRLTLQGDYYKADVENLITVVVVGFYTNPVLGRRPIQQYQNVSKAEREGFELQASLSQGAFSGQVAYSQIRVRDRLTGANLFAPPDKWTLSLAYAFSPAVDLRWSSMWVEAQDYDSTLLRRRPAYETHDLFVTWAPQGRTWRFDAGVTNLFDERYAAYKQSTAYPNVYEQGRNFRLGVSRHF